jgi:zinc protease
VSRRRASLLLIAALGLAGSGCCARAQRLAAARAAALSGSADTAPASDTAGGTGVAAAVPPTVPWDSAGIDWSKPPPPGPEAALVLPEPEAFTLGNGLRVLVVRRPRLPLVSLLLVDPAAGASRDPSGEGGLAGFTADLLDEGAGKLDALGLAAALERLGAHLEVGIGPDAAEIALDTLTATLPDSLALLADVVARPRFAAADVARVKADRLALIALRRDQPRSVAPLLFERLLFGAHPYAQPAYGDADSVRRLGRGDVRRFYRRHYAPALSTLIVAGDVEIESLRRMLEPTLGAWRGDRSAARAAAPRSHRPPAPAARLVLVDRPGAPQAVVQIGGLGLPRTDPRIHTAAVANSLLGGSFTSRLNARLREELGYTYGAGSSVWSGVDTGSWSIVTSLKSERTVAGIREILAILDTLGRDEPAADELSRNVQLLVQELPARFQSNGSTVAAFADLAPYGLPLDWYAQRAAALRKVTAAEVRDLVAALLRRDRLTLVVVGDLARLRNDLGRLGFPAAIELDPEGAPAPPALAPAPPPPIPSALAPAPSALAPAAAAR